MCITKADLFSKFKRVLKPSLHKLSDDYLREISVVMECLDMIRQDSKLNGVAQLIC